MGLRLGLKIKIFDGWDKIFPVLDKNKGGPLLRMQTDGQAVHSGQAINEMTGHGQLLD